MLHYTCGQMPARMDEPGWEEKLETLMKVTDSEKKKNEQLIGQIKLLEGENRVSKQELGKLQSANNALMFRCSEDEKSLEKTIKENKAKKDDMSKYMKMNTEQQTKLAICESKINALSEENADLARLLDKAAKDLSELKKTKAGQDSVVAASKDEIEKLKQEAQKLKGELSTFAVKHESALQQLEGNKKLIDELEQNVKSKNEEIQGLKIVNTGLDRRTTENSQQFKQLVKSEAALRGKLEDRIQLCNKLKDQNQKLEISNERLNGQLDTSKQEYNLVISRNTALERQITHYKELEEDFKTKLNKAFNELASSCRKSDETLKLLDKEKELHSTVYKDFEEARKEVEKFKNQVDEITKDRNSLKQRLTELQCVVNQLEGKLADEEVKYEHLEANLAMTRESLGGQLQDSDGMIMELNNRLDYCEARNQTLEDRLAKWSQENENLMEQLKKSEKKSKELEAWSSKTDSFNLKNNFQIDLLKHKEEEKDKLAKDLKNELDKMKKTNANFQQQIFDLKEEIDTFKGRNYCSERETIAMKMKNEEIIGRMSSLSSQNKGFEKINEALNTDLERAKEDVVALKGRNDELKNHLFESSTRVKKLENDLADSQKTVNDLKNQCNKVGSERIALDIVKNQQEEELKTALRGNKRLQEDLGNALEELEELERCRKSLKELQEELCDAKKGAANQKCTINNRQKALDREKFNKKRVENELSRIKEAMSSLKNKINRKENALNGEKEKVISLKKTITEITDPTHFIP